ncbi:hypothetical protein EMQ25_08760 [Arsenicitalea aurantiaca]|uniref:Uncharacterized protein n=1 Tax=Arsenicitalea aurantiaca TaxID=1783274 RepID=A0A433XA42_9HYPH|nr:hypothetical protein [Arsenicitalea aurantiaca]RUT30961.1 hypothetical protein EMQ25_08760 [Arsenicitalea aurantiaca]
MTLSITEEGASAAAPQTMSTTRAVLGALPAIFLVLGYAWGTIATIGWVIAMVLGGSVLAFALVGLPGVALGGWITLGFVRSAIAGEREHG